MKGWSVTTGWPSFNSLLTSLPRLASSVGHLSPHPPPDRPPITPFSPRSLRSLVASPLRSFVTPFHRSCSLRSRRKEWSERRVRLAAVPFIVTLVPRLSRSSSLRSSSLHSLHGPSVLTSFAPEPGPHSLHSLVSPSYPLFSRRITVTPPSAVPSGDGTTGDGRADMKVMGSVRGSFLRSFPCPSTRPTRGRSFVTLRSRSPLTVTALHPTTPAHPATLRSAPSHAPLTPRGPLATLVASRWRVFRRTA